MSSNCPPQLQLSIQPNTTSFKRSFEQFGFDVESPVVTDTGAAATATSDGRNERNKRARSASSFDSEISSNLSSDTTASTSSSRSSAMSEGGAVDAFPVPTSIEPPRLPTPEIQDVEMPDYPAGEPIEVEREGLHESGQYRLSLGSFNDFNNEIAVLHQAPSTTTTSPPTLPPLRHRLLQDAFFRRIESPGSPFSPTFFDESHPTTNNSDSPQLHTQHPAEDAVESAVHSNSHFDLFRESQPFPSLSLSIPATEPPPTPGFRDRLDSALERLRSPSPLVPGLEDDEDRRDEEDGDEEEEEEEEDEPMAEREAEPETEEIDESNTIQELPPTLPPIRTVENLLIGRTMLPALSTTQSVPPDPPMLPPIPVIASDVATNPAERAWQARNELFPERFEDFMRMNRLFAPTPENNPTVAPSPPQSSAADTRETAASTSPRPFSRSARSALSSFRPRPVTTNPTLVDHPLPSPILRDLRSWLEERQPTLSNDPNFSYSLLRADDASSVSSISTAAATAGTERGTSASLTASSSSAAQASSSTGPSTASESSTSQQDRLSRMLDRIRTSSRLDDWAEHGTRRAWLSPPLSAPAPPVENDSTHTMRDLLPWFTGDPSPASAFGSAVPSATPEASRPISTTPAPGSSAMGRNEDLALDSYWEPVFTNLPEATFASTSSTRNRASEQGSSMLASDDRSSDSAAITTSGPPSSPTRVEASSLSDYFNHILNRSEDTGRTINPADVSSNGDRNTNDSAAGMWRPLESSDLPLNLSFNSTSTSSPNTRPQPSLIHNTPNYFDGQPSPTFDPPSIPSSSYFYGTSTLNRGTPENYTHGWAPPSPETSPMTSLAREQIRRMMDTQASLLRQRETLAMREMFDMTEHPTQSSSLSPSSLRNWNGRLVEEDGPQSQSQSRPQAPASQSLAVRPEATTSSVSTRNSEISSSIESRRTDPRLRHRLLRSSSSQMRLGSSNSLVTENASEVRRRADHAEIRRLPAERNSLFGLNMEDHLTDNSDRAGATERPRRESSWENVLLQRALDEGERRRRASITSERSVSRMPVRASSPSVSSMFTSAFVESSALPSLTTFVDGLNPATRGATAGNTDEQPRHPQLPTPTSGPPISPDLDIWSMMPTEGLFGGGTDSSQPPRHDAPSLPPPDLGSSFNAGHHSRSMSASWVSTEENSVDDPMGASVVSATPEPMRINNTNERPNNVPQRSSGLRPLILSSTLSPGGHQSPELEQQSGRTTLYQITSEERARRLQLERRLQEDHRRFTSALRARHPIPSGLNPSRPSPLSNGSGASSATSPTSAATTASSSALASGISRHLPGGLRRPSMGDALGVHTLFDPSTFTPGPFRNTLQHIANEREGLPATRLESNATRSTPRRPPPYIPPLSFDTENEHHISSPRQADNVEERTRQSFVQSILNPTVREGAGMNGPGTQRAPRIIRELPFESHSPTRTIPQDDYSSGPRNSSPIVANEASSTYGPNGSRRVADNSRSNTLNMHRYLSEQARMEARLEDPRYSFYPPVFPSMIEPIRPDNSGTNAARSIQRYHRERELISRTEEEEDTAPPSDTRARRRGRVLRAHQEAVMSFARVSTAAGWRRGRALGDFMRDEDFDDSYENLLSLSMQIGDAKPRATPSEILEKMEKGIYKDWATDGSDTRCPICLDDYAPTDPVQKLSNCSHWLHQECLTQWLQSATTCPVCRESVNISPSSPFSASRLPRYPPRLNPFNMPLSRRRRESSPPTHNQPSSPAAQGSNTDGRDTNNRNGGQGTNRPQESPSRSPFPAPWRHRPA